MFPVTLEFKDGTTATCSPPCYGFLRGAEWDDWSQRFHFDSFNLVYTRRERMFDAAEITEAEPFGRNMFRTAVESGDDDLPSNLFQLEDLRVIWNSGARIPAEYRITAKDEPVAWRFSCDYAPSKPIYDKSELMPGKAGARGPSPLETFHQKHGMYLSLEKVMTDLEKAIDHGRESILDFRSNEFGTILGVKTLDVPCDRVLFYLMVGRELEGFNQCDKVQTFLQLHYLMGVPIMVAFMASRVLAWRTNNFDKPPYFSGNNGDSCILPAQNLWVGCAARFTKPTAIQWEQHAYTSGEGHNRDDDMGSFYMEPKLEGFGEISEEYNESMFNAVFGGYVENNGSTMLDRPGGEPVANLVAEFYRSVVSEEYYRNRGSNTYCSYWTSECDLQDSSTKQYHVLKGNLWMDKLISLLTEE